MGSPCVKASAGTALTQPRLAVGDLRGGGAIQKDGERLEPCFGFLLHGVVSALSRGFSGKQHQTRLHGRARHDQHLETRRRMMRSGGGGGGGGEFARTMHNIVCATRFIFVL